MQLVIRPETFDVLVAPNLYGDIVSDLCAGLVGGLAFAPSGNIGDEYRIYEAVHGSAPDIAGKNVANPSALLLAFALMLEDLGMQDKANALREALAKVVEEGNVVTPDIGGSATTDEFSAEIIKKLLQEVNEMPSHSLFEKNSHGSLGNRIFDILRDRILNVEYKTGQK